MFREENSSLHLSPSFLNPITPKKYRLIYIQATVTHSSSTSSNWILMTCQPHRVTAGQSNSGHKQIHISKLFSDIYISTFCQVNLQNQSLRKHKTYIHKYQTQIFEGLVPSVLPPLKEQIRLGHAGIVDHSV